MKNQFFTLPYHPAKLLWGNPLDLSTLHLVCVVSPGSPLTAGQMAEALNAQAEAGK